MMKERAKTLYRDFARKGRYREAGHVLRLLRQGWIGLGLRDDETAVEIALERNGFAVGGWAGDGGYLRVYLRPAKG